MQRRCAGPGWHQAAPGPGPGPGKGRGFPAPVTEERHGKHGAAGVGVEKVVRGKQGVIRWGRRVPALGLRVSALGLRVPALGLRRWAGMNESRRCWVRAVLQTA